MKQIISMAVICLTIITHVFSQIKEPTFIGEVSYVNNGAMTLLEKCRATIETRAGASMYIIGMGKISSKITVDNATSSLRLEPGIELEFIVKTRDNEIDPLSIVNIFKFKPGIIRKARFAEVSSSGTFSGISSNNFEYIDFEAEKFGEQSYLIRVPALSIGEYGILVNDPSITGPKIQIISCFGIGTVEEYNTKIKTEKYYYPVPEYDGD